MLSMHCLAAPDRPVQRRLLNWSQIIATALWSNGVPLRAPQVIDLLSDLATSETSSEGAGAARAVLLALGKHAASNLNVVRPLTSRTSPESGTTTTGAPPAAAGGLAEGPAADQLMQQAPALAGQLQPLPLPLPAGKALHSSPHKRLLQALQVSQRFLGQQRHHGS
jgi:hypothetical protein